VPPRHLRTVSTATRSRSAIALLDSASAASSTIFARITTRCAVVPARVSRRRYSRSASFNAITSMLATGIEVSFR